MPLTMVNTELERKPNFTIGVDLLKEKINKIPVAVRELNLMDPKHLGRVYIKQENGSENVLDGVLFSNLDWNWYQADGTHHPMLEKYRARKMSLRFVVANKDKFGKNVEFTASLLCPLGVGQTGAIDWKGIAAAERLEMEYGMQFGTFKSYDDQYVKGLQGAACSALAVMMSPHKKFTDIIPFVVYLSYCYVMDDVVDTDTVHNRQLCYKELATTFATMEEVLLHGKDPEAVENPFDIPNLKPICRYIKYLRKLLVDNCRPETINTSFRDLIETFNAASLAHSKEWQEFKSGPAKESARRMYSSMRILDGAAMPTIDVQQMIYGHRLDPIVEKSFMHRHIVKSVAMQIALVNDIMSYRKDVMEKDTFNTVYMNHTIGGMTLEEAFQENVREANGIVEDTLETAKLMLEIFGEDSPDLKDALYLYKSNIMGHIQWYNYALRYHGGVVLDIVVHHDYI